MDRSIAKMSDKLQVGEAAGETNEFRWWPFINMRLIAKGRDVWVSSIKDGPKSARGPTSFEVFVCMFCVSVCQVDAVERCGCESQSR